MGFMLPFAGAPMKDRFEIEPEDLARILVMIELDGIVWEGNAYTQHFLEHHAGELIRALIKAGYRGAELVVAAQAFDDGGTPTYWMFNPQRFNAPSAKAWVARQLGAFSRSR